jgi:hypothetical protein
MLPDILFLKEVVAAYASLPEVDQDLTGILKQLLHIAEKQQQQINNLQSQLNSLRATRPRTIHEDPPLRFNSLTT